MKIITIFFLLAFCSQAWAAEITGMTKEQVALVQALIVGNGYKCDTIDMATSFEGNSRYKMFCNGYRYVYEVKDVGGNWKVSVK